MLLLAGNNVFVESILDCVCQLDETRDPEVQPDSRISTTDIPKENKKLAFIHFALWFVQGTAKWKGEKFC